MRDSVEAGSSRGLPVTFIRFLVAAALMCTAAGCAEYRLTIADSDPTDIHYQDVTMNAYFWGTLMSPQAQEAKCEGDGINDVVVVDNLGYDLVSLITLGIWKPISLRYRCLAPSGPPSVTLPE